MNGSAKLISAAMLATLLAGCASTPTPMPIAEAQPTISSSPPDHPEPAPSKPFKPILSQSAARQILVSGRSRAWKDPNSVREAKIGDAYECLAQDGSTCFCIEANAKNSYGGFAGLKMSQARFSSPKQFEMIEMYAPEHCGRMIPFPEMNGR
jgi:hypothetical protein